jgi:hypothetical protein
MFFLGSLDLSAAMEPSGNAFSWQIHVYIPMERGIGDAKPMDSQFGRGSVDSCRRPGSAL